MAMERMLGIVGGVGPESTADYYRRLIGRWRERGPTGTYPSIVVDSLNSKPALDALLDGNLDPAVRLFDTSVARPARVLAQGGHLPAGRRGLGVRVRVERQYVVADEVLDEGERASRGGVVGVDERTRPEWTLDARIVPITEAMIVAIRGST